MGHKKLIDRYLAAWHEKDVSGLIKLMDPQGSYYDAFWGETCSGDNLQKYFEDSFALESYWYRVDEEPISTPNGVIFRYVVFDQDDPEGLKPLFNGAEILSLSDGLIMTISDYYCDPNRVDLIELASLAEKQHSRANIAPLGLSAKVSGRIVRRLKELATDMKVFLDPSLTVTQLADHVGCSVMHLFHVLEEKEDTSFLQYVFECRARYAATLLESAPNGDIDLHQVAEQSGFETVAEFRNAFRLTFGLSAKEYRKNLSQ